MQIQNEVISQAKKHIQDLLAAQAPCQVSDIEFYLVEQCPGVEFSNSPEVTFAAMGQLIQEGVVNRGDEPESLIEVGWELA